MPSINFALLGAGGFAREVMPYVRESVAKSLCVAPEDVAAHFVETWAPENKAVNDHPLICLEEFLSLPGQRYFNIAIGDGKTRAAIAQQIGDGASCLNLLSPSTTIMENNEIGEGAIFCPYTMVTSNVRIGRFFNAHAYSYVAHDCVIGDFVTFAPGVRCNGRVHIDDHAYIGSNASIREGTAGKPLRIGHSAVVGMGAVVIRDVPDGAVVLGNPARPLCR